MASYQARKRDPLLDSNTQAMVEKRSKELLGIGLIIAGKPLNRDDDDDAPSVSSGGGHAAIPKAGKPRRGDEGEPDPGMEPQPN